MNYLIKFLKAKYQETYKPLSNLLFSDSSTFGHDYGGKLTNEGSPIDPLGGMSILIIMRFGNYEATLDFKIVSMQFLNLTNSIQILEIVHAINSRKNKITLYLRALSDL